MFDSLSKPWKSKSEKPIPSVGWWRSETLPSIFLSLSLLQEWKKMIFCAAFSSQMWCLWFSCYVGHWKLFYWRSFIYLQLIPISVPKFDGSFSRSNPTKIHYFPVNKMPKFLLEYLELMKLPNQQSWHRKLACHFHYQQYNSQKVYRRIRQQKLQENDFPFIWIKSSNFVMFHKTKYPFSS